MKSSLLIASLCVLMLGCVHMPALPEMGTAQGTPRPGYRLGAADVVVLQFRDRPQWNMVVSVDVDGCLPIEEIGSPRATGLTAEELRQAVASSTGLDPDGIHIEIEDARRARLLILGPDNGRQRVVPYLGPETVLEVLIRVGALRPNATNWHDVYVLRPNVAEGRPAEVFTVDLEAILLDHDGRTNIVVNPADQIYVGETRRSSFVRLLPEWMKPIYRQIMGLLPEPFIGLRMKRLGLPHPNA